jgi:hypothetical protein
MRSLGGTVISVARHWCRLKGENYINTLHFILPDHRAHFKYKTLREKGLVWKMIWYYYYCSCLSEKLLVPSSF